MLEASTGSISVRRYSMTTYLYVKQHKITGLKYFGKTTSSDPYKYTGSGLYWSAHLAKHGADIETLNLWTFEDIDECEKFAKDFSQKHNIVESLEWANLKNENGKDGGFSGYRWYSNGVEDRLCLKSPGEDWRLGRLNQRPITQGYRWYNNGKINISSSEKPIGDEWKEGMLPKNLPSLKDNTHNFFRPEHREILKKKNQELLKSGNHSTQQCWVCETCGKSGKGLSNYSRWHGKNCREFY